MQPATLSYSFLIRLPWIFVRLGAITFLSMFFHSIKILTVLPGEIQLACFHPAVAF